MDSSASYEYKGDTGLCKFYVLTKSSAGPKGSLEFRIERFELQTPAPDGGRYVFQVRGLPDFWNSILDRRSSDAPDALAMALKEYLADFLHDQVALDFLEDKLSRFLKARHPEPETIVGCAEIVCVLDWEEFIEACGRLTMEGYRGALAAATDEGSVETCAICLEALQVSYVMESTSCGHVFHWICIKPWLAKKTTCPLCRARISG